MTNPINPAQESVLPVVRWLLTGPDGHTFCVDGDKLDLVDWYQKQARHTAIPLVTLASAQSQLSDMRKELEDATYCQQQDARRLAWWQDQFQSISRAQTRTVAEELAALRAERDDAVQKMQAGWLEVADSGIQHFVQENDRLRAELEAAKKDAERYRYLRTTCVYEGSSDWTFSVWGRFATVEEAIDKQIELRALSQQSDGRGE